MTVSLHCKYTSHRTLSEYTLLISAPSLTQTNSFQGILVTDGYQSYTIFLYRCGELEWPGDSTIGFIANEEFYYNHRLSGTREANDIACLNINTGTPWTTLVYRIAPRPVENRNISFSALINPHRTTVSHVEFLLLRWN